MLELAGGRCRLTFAYVHIGVVLVDHTRDHVHMSLEAAAYMVAAGLNYVGTPRARDPT